MITDYTHIGSEVLGQMVQVAKQDSNLTDDERATLYAAVEARKRKLDEKLKQIGEERVRETRLRNTIEVYKELIALDPENYEYYQKAAQNSFWLKDYHAAVAYYTSALQVVEDDPEIIWELYKERARIYLRLENFSQSLEDGKNALRFKYLTNKDTDFIGHETNYSSILYYICEGLKGVGNHELAQEIDTIRLFTEGSEYRLHDRLIAEFFVLLNIPSPIEATIEKDPDTSFPYINIIKQLISNEPVDVEKRELRKQFREEYDYGDRDYSQLRPTMERLIALEPDNYRYHAAAGQICNYLEDYGVAVTHFTNAHPLLQEHEDDFWWGFRVRPRHLYTLYQERAHALARLKRYREAIEDAEHALRTKPTDKKADVTIALLIFCYQHNCPNPQDLSGRFESIFGYPLGSAEARAGLQKERDRGIEFVDFSEAGTDKGPRERTAMSVFLDFGYSKQEQLEDERKATEALGKFEELFTIIGESVSAS